MKWILAVILAVLVGVAAAGLLAYRTFIQTPLDIGTPTAFEVSSGEVYPRVWQRFEQRGWTDATWQWRVLGRLSPLASGLKAGEYEIVPGMTPEAVLAKLASGDVMLYPVQFIEGETLRQSLQRLWQVEAFTRQLPQEDVDSAIMRLFDVDWPGAEGLILPETYHFPRGSSDKEVLLAAHRALESLLESQWQTRASDLPYDRPYDALIMASIIEKETAVAQERTQIAGVFVNRLNKRMRLQTDPTVIYGLGADFDGNIRRADLRTDTPYNTYTRHGLPPTPIALAGRASIVAALHPDDTEALYFVSRGDGTHQFSTTLAEHEAAVDKYIRNRP